MPREWYQRLYLVLFVVFGSIYLLIPTFFWHPKGAGLTIGAETPVATPLAPAPAGVLTNPTSGTTTQASVATPAAAMATGSAGAATATVAKTDDTPGWMSFFPKKRLNLGLDLVGGSHLALGVDTDEAMRGIAANDRRELKDKLTKDALAFEGVDQPVGTATIRVTLKDPNDREALKKAVTKIDTRLEETSWSESDGKAVATFAFRASDVTQLESDAVKSVLDVLRTRINSFGVSEPIIFQEKSDRIVVELPGLKDPAQAIENIKRTARLEFHIVDEDASGHTDPKKLLEVVNQINAKLPPLDQNDPILISKVLIEQKLIPDDDAVYMGRSENPEWIGYYPYILKRDAVLTGDKLASAFPATDRFGSWIVSFKLNADGAEKFGEVTTENIHKRLAIVLENIVETAPVINSPITEGSGEIELGSTTDRNKQQADAINISRVLQTGALPAQVRIEQNRTVGPSLGQDSIRRGLEASLLGFTLVFFFAWYWYRWSGFIATIALAANGVVMLAAMTFFDATLTLPGIAGIVLTTGMAVDANVLIYERIREELRLGKTVRPAIEAGFDRAFLTIIDAHMTTAIAGVALYWKGTDQIRGFAITLLLGIATSLFTALVISRLCFDWWTTKLKPQTLSI